MHSSLLIACAYKRPNARQVRRSALKELNFDCFGLFDVSEVMYSK